MTAPIDLEALRSVLSVLQYEACTIPSDSRDYGPQREQDVADIEGAHYSVQLALAELTTRRARDAEVEALASAAAPFVALLQRHNEFDETGAPVNGHTPIFGINDVVIRVGDLRMLRAALLPFQRNGAKT